MSIKISIKNRAERLARPQFSLVGFVGCFVGPWSVASQPDKMLVPSRLSCTYVSCKEPPPPRVAFASRFKKIFVLPSFDCSNFFSLSVLPSWHVCTSGSADIFTRGLALQKFCELPMFLCGGDYPNSRKARKNTDRTGGTFLYVQYADFKG